MTNTAKSVIEKALKLRASERAAVAERILMSLDTPNPEIDAAWACEADARVEAYERGDIEAISARAVFAKYKC
ncbi:addiction module protein [Dokdonella sp.]|uniref:addiction module protein n=1 Tax=Dokdonella sp. TaxID=2291710 RepID=UPI0039C8B005